MLFVRLFEHDYRHVENRRSINNNDKIPYKSNFSELGKLFISSSVFLLLEYESNEKKTREIYSMEKRSDFNN